MTPQIADRHSWKTLEPPERLEELQYSDQFTQAEYETIERGLVPEEMEDKWFIFYEHPTLYLHLSWTGSLVYRLTLERDHDGAHVICAEVSPQYLRTSDEKMLRWVIRHVLLRQKVDFPHS